ncbi:DUF3800 domain-containing protein [Gloeocapsa sp. BRSZ]
MKLQYSEFALYLDDSGSPKPNPKDQCSFFGMGGVLINRGHEQIIEALVLEFKQRWNIAVDIPLHGSEIRSKKNNYDWLGNLSEVEYQQFMEDLTNTIVRCPIIVHACVISRHGYLKRYLEKYGEDTWEMMKSAFTILVERAAKYVAAKNGTLMVYFEAAGKREDRLIKSYFNELRSQGHPFDTVRANKYFPLSANDFSSLLRGIDSKKKSNAVMQIADLCLYPVVTSKTNPNNQAFLSLKKARLLVDCDLELSLVDSLGVKYYCFDDYP